jgi:hypothetical protein
MFERIDIRLTEPVCNCCDGDYENASMEWSIATVDGKTGLQISCKECKTSIIVPSKKFVARFIYLNPSPKKKTLENKDNVIHLNPK